MGFGSLDGTVFFQMGLFCNPLQTIAYKWLKEGDKIERIENHEEDDHAPDLHVVSHHPNQQVPNHQSYQLKKELSRRRSD